MKQLSIYERVREQEELARKFHEVEVKILSTLDFGELFSVLLEEIARTFQIPSVWFSLIEDSEIAGLLRQTGKTGRLRRSVALVEASIFSGLIPGPTPTLHNENLAPFRKLLPPGERPLLHSIAIIPVSLDGEAVGSLNFGDPSTDRFRPGFRTDLLERLAVKVSLCLSNVTAHEKLKMIAHRDPLTNLYNRRIMETILAREQARATRYNTPLSVVFLDLDDFKRINDTWGHDCGDRLLQYLAEALTTTCRDSDLVTRFAGDEFVLLLPDTSQSAAIQLMERICANLRCHPFPSPDGPYLVSLSYGIANAREIAHPDAAALLKLADERLYTSKKARKTPPTDSLFAPHLP